MPRAATLLALLAGSVPGCFAKISSIYTICSSSSSLAWLQILQHFQETLRHASGDDIEVKVVTFNVSSPARVISAGLLMPLATPSVKSLVWLQRVAAALTSSRENAWAVSMYFKVQLWHRLAGLPANAGKIVVGADADHTFFPGWEVPVEECLLSRDICFQMNWKSIGSEFEQQNRTLALDTRRSSIGDFWSEGWPNTGFFAMRCGSRARKFWHEVLEDVHAEMDDLTGVHDQVSVGHVLMRSSPESYTYGFLDPFAINQASFYSYLPRQPLSPAAIAHSFRNGVLLHHAAYTGGLRETFCQKLGEVRCKLALMKLVNRTWHRQLSRRGWKDAQRLEAQKRGGCCNSFE